MPRPKRAPSTHDLTPSAVIASAAEITATKIAVPKGGGVRPWQEQGWYFYDTVGEFRYASNWKAQACSRARLVITEDSPEGDKPISDGVEVEALDILFGGEVGHASMLERVALHMGIPGESYVVGEPGENPGDPESWDVMSNDELSRQGGAGSKTWKVDRGDEARDLREGSTVLRLWRPHPRKWVEATSPTRAVLPVLAQIEELSKHISATIDSRLAGAGLLAYPSEAEVKADAEHPEMDPVLAMLIRSMVAAKQDRGSAAAVAPTVLKMPGEFLDKLKHVTFSTPFDERTKELLDLKIRRLALGLDMPPEQLLGLGDSNHWSAWQVDEAGLKTSVEPELEVITTGLTQVWLQAAVKALGGTVNPRRRINYDVSDLRLRQDRSQQAFEAYDRLELSGAALRREVGFEPGDAPKDDERLQIAYRKLALAAPPPEVVTMALRAMGANPPPPALGQGTAPAGESAEPAPVEPTPESDARDLPTDTAVQVAASLIASRAIERANNRANNRAKVRKPIPVDKLDAALAGSYDQAPAAAAALGVDPGVFVAGIDQYVRAVLTEGTDQQPRVLARCLAPCTATKELTGG